MKRSTRNFIILSVGMLILFSLATYTIVNRIQLSHHQFTSEKKARVLKQIQQRLQQQGRVRTVMPMQRPGLRIHPQDNNLNNSTTISQPITRDFKQWLDNNPKANRFSIRYYRSHNPNKPRWVIVEFMPNQINHSFLNLDTWILLWLTVLFFALCFWLVYDFNKPLKQLRQLSNTLSQGHFPLQVLTIESNEIAPITESINQLSARITQLLNDRTQMLAAISHDLRTPITRLRLRAENITDPSQREKIWHDLDDMETMIKGVLEFVQAESDEAMVNFDLIALLDTLCHERQDAQQPCSFQCDLKSLTYHGQMQALRRAFANLIDNAIKYGKQADIRLLKKNQTVQITIDDQGPGIPEQELSRVFQPFYRVETSRNKATGGTGLGLVIAKNIIQQHQGDIHLSNNPHGGLHVRVSLKG